jgi:hypothetical protein
VENRAPVKPRIPLEIGIATHEMVESFWKGDPFEVALAGAMEYCNNVPTHLFDTEERRKWDENVNKVPDISAYYYDNVEYKPDDLLLIDAKPCVEREWRIESPFGIEGVGICGRMDRVHIGPTIKDTKTASEINPKSWKKNFKAEKLRDPGLAIYDYYLCELGYTPLAIELEVIVKPFRDKGCRIEIFPMPEIMAYRKRFAAQLKWHLKEIKHYHESYLEAKPWPMALTHACTHKYGHCDFIAGCNGGWTPKTEKLYAIRREHLEVRREQTNEHGVS